MKKIMMQQNDVAEFIDKIKAMLLGDKGIPDKLNLDVNASTKLKEEDKVEVLFENEAYKKMNALVENCDKEIGWYGTVERTSEKQFLIKDIIMFPQMVTQVTVQEDESVDNDWRDLLPDEMFNSMRFYGHSHVRMSCSPSVTDSNFYKNMIQNINDFYVFGIFNKNATNNYWFNIYDITNNILYEKDDIIYKYLITPADMWAEAQIKEFVKEEKPYVPSTYNNYGKKDDKKGNNDWDYYSRWNEEYLNYQDQEAR